MSSLFRPRNTFLQNNSWQNQALNALHYNTSQQGSVLPLIYGTVRQQVNLIDMDGYRGPTGKKGKTGSLPISGTSQTGKGGGSSKGKGSKKSGHYTINVDFAMCQGPVTFNSGNSVFSSSGVEAFSASGLWFHSGYDGQTADTHFNKVAYSGTCHITGVPMDLGQSPVIPNIAFEITGILAGVHSGGSYNRDANPADVITDFLTNLRYGAAFPSSCLSQLQHDDTGTITNTYGDYCQAANLLISTALDGHQKAIEWLNGILTLTNSALVWSGRFLKIIPYGDLALNSNDAAWTPNWTARYNLNDDHFLPWHPRAEGSGPTPGEEDPVIVTRTNPADADNWVSIEYMDRDNFYNSTTITSFDQGAIDTYGLRIGDSLPGRAFANQYSAQISLQLILQRRLYIRNTGIKFQLGWQFCLLEPMDLVAISGRFGDNYLDHYIVRITVIEENDNGDLSFTCEDPQPGTSAPVTSPPPLGAAFLGSVDLGWPLGKNTDPNTGLVLIDPGNGASGWDQNGPANGDNKGTWSTWFNVPAANAPASGSSCGFVMCQAPSSSSVFPYWPLAIVMDNTGVMAVYLGHVICYQSEASVFPYDGNWHHCLVTWDCPDVKMWIDGNEHANVWTFPTGAPPLGPPPTTINWQWAWDMHFYTSGLLFAWAGCINGCVQDGWWTTGYQINDPSKFRTPMGRPANLGFRGELVTGTPPRAYFHDYAVGYVGPDPINIHRTGYFYYSENRAGNHGDWNDSSPPYNLWPSGGVGDPAYPRCEIGGSSASDCTSNPY